MEVQTLSDYIEHGVDEKLVRKKVIRDGKRVIIKRTNKAGFKSVNGKTEVKMTAKEKITRQKSQKIGKLKRKAHQKQSTNKRKLSMRKK